MIFPAAQIISSMAQFEPLCKIDGVFSARHFGLSDTGVPDKQYQADEFRHCFTSDPLALR